jgi:hypothetical protein
MTHFTEFYLQSLDSIAIEAVNDLAFNSAFFSRRDLIKKIEEKLPRSVLSSERRETVEEMIKRVGLVPLYPSQIENDWTQYTTMKMVRLEREMVEMAKKTSKNHEIPNQPNAIQDLVKKAFISRPTMADEQKAVV